AGRDVLLDGADAPAGSPQNMLAAVADIRAGETVDVSGGRFVDMRANAILKADDGNPSTSTGVIRLTAGETLYVRSDAFGGHEVYLHSGGDVELRAELDSGHLIDVRAGLGPTGVGSVITDINADLATSGSEIHMLAGPKGGNLLLNDAQIYTAGPIELTAPAGALINTGGWILADTMTATARDGITGQIDVRKLYAAITGDGDLALTTAGDVTLADVSVANGSVDVQGFGNVVAQIVKTLGGDGDVTLGSYGGNLTLGMIQAAGTFSAQANVGDILQSAGGSISAADVSFTGELPPNLNLSANELTIVAYQPGDIVINHPSTETLTLVEVWVLDGSLIVNTGGDLIVKDARLLTPKTTNQVSLVAGGDVVIEKLWAGEYVADATAAADARTRLGLPAETKFSSVSDVSIVAGGSISGGGSTDVDDEVDLVADQVTLRAHDSIGNFELAVNRIVDVTSTTGAIDLHDDDGFDEQSPGLALERAAAPAGAISISSAGTFLVGSVVA
ncbi:MAG TPA: hypothetical protein PLV92_22755, partial [Pirellulaceae bacterium]|nr:hypothetical protein [Pirellulaceae bacterium]